MVTINLIDATFNDSSNLPFFKYINSKNLKQLPELGYFGYNWFSAEHYSLYLKNLNLKPNEFMLNFDPIKRKITQIRANRTF
jgi:hypothetical protein